MLLWEFSDTVDLTSSGAQVVMPVTGSDCEYRWSFTCWPTHTLLLLCGMVPAATAKSLQSCPTLWDPIDGSPPGSSVPGILQARTLEWVAISFSNAWKWKVKVKSLSRVRLCATPWTAAYQALLSMGFSRQEYWSEVPLPSPEWFLSGHKQVPVCDLGLGTPGLDNI